VCFRDAHTLAYALPAMDMMLMMMHARWPQTPSPSAREEMPPSEFQYLPKRRRANERDQIRLRLSWHVR